MPKTSKSWQYYADLILILATFFTTITSYVLPSHAMIKVEMGKLF